MKKQYPLRKKFQYHLDDFISRGVWAQLLLLVGCVAIITIVFGLILWYFEEDVALNESLWDSLMHVIDQGTITGDERDNSRYLVVMLLATFVGMGFTGAIIGIIGNGLQQKMEELNKGHTRIFEKDHVVVLGFNERTHIICSEIEDGNYKKKGKHCLVVVGDLPKEEMERTVKEIRWSRKKPGEDEKVIQQKEKKTNTIFRSGDLVSKDTYVMCAVDRARSIIVNGSDDFETIRVLLGLTEYLKRSNAYIKNDKMPSVVAMINDPENISAAKIAADVNHERGTRDYKEKNEYKVRILFFKEILSRLFAQICIHPGLSSVMNEILKGESQSFFIEDKSTEKENSFEKAFLGKGINEISNLVMGAIPVGFAGVDEKNQIYMDLNPIEDIKYTKNDHLIYLADDIDSLMLRTGKQATPIGEPSLNVQGQESNSKHFLILGCNNDLEKLLNNLNDFSDDKCNLNVITECESEITDYHSGRDTRIITTVDPYNWDCAKKILDENPYWFDESNERHITNIVIITNDGIDPQQADEKVMVLLLNIREYLKKKCQFDVNITTEIRFPQNQALVQRMSVNDYVVSSRIASSFLVQIAEDPKKYYVFEELLKQRREIVVLKSFSEYVDVTKPFNYEGIYREVMRKAKESGKQEILLGWIKIKKNSIHGDDSKESITMLKFNPQEDDREQLFESEDRNFDDYSLIIIKHRQ